MMGKIEEIYLTFLAWILMPFLLIGYFIYLGVRKIKEILVK